MTDTCIIELYFLRDEKAIEESRLKYGSYCHSIAYNILGSKEDSEECVNDTWLGAWNAIPPNRPHKLALFLGGITRKISIDLFRKRTAGKRGGGETAICLEELEECTGKGDCGGEALELKDALDRFLDRTKPKAKKVFVLRYWYMLTVKETARLCGMTEGQVKMSLKRTREKLKKFLEKEGIEI